MQDAADVFNPMAGQIDDLVQGSRSRQSGGTGLGLFIAKELAGRQGGSLHLRNRDGGGLSAEVTLPA